MVKVTSLCTNCVQIMTNPICPACFVRHINYWLRDRNLGQKEMQSVLIGLSRVIKDSEESPADISCIVCGERKVNLCTYCFTNKASKVLETNLRQDVLKDFTDDFETIIWRV